MTDASSKRSGHCARARHAECPHLAEPAGRVSVWRPRPWSEWTFFVCDCDCHAGCPLAGQDTVQREEWRRQCTCAGAAWVRNAQDRALRRREEVAAVLTEARRAGRWDAAEIESRLRGVYEAHEETPPPGLTGLSRLLVTASARRGTRTPRLLWMAAEGIGGVVRWAWRPAGADARAEHNRAQSRAGLRSVGVLAAVASVVTVAASTSSGRRRRIWGLVAAVVWLATAWTGVLVTGVSLVARLTEDRADGGPGHLP